MKKFPGFPPEPSMNFWSYPKDLNGYWHQLTGSEQKVLDYVLRHTWGFKKVADEISLTQLQKGIKNFDKGTGLARQTIITALKGLIRKGFISKKPGEKANYYELVKNLDYPSLKIRQVGSQKFKPTIDNYAIKKKQYAFSKKKPFYKGEEMRWSQGRWWVIPKEGGQWYEFAGQESEIEWKEYVR